VSVGSERESENVRLSVKVLLGVGGILIVWVWVKVTLGVGGGVIVSVLVGSSLWDWDMLSGLRDCVGEISSE
jgi:hypothetical protein